MKQNITKKQWDELDEKEQRKFLKFLGYSDVSIDNKYDCDKYIPKDVKVEAGIKADIKYIKYCHLSNITIGVMIKFLGDDWYENKELFVGDNDCGVHYVGAKELCDALWSAVKYKLDK